MVGVEVGSIVHYKAREDIGCLPGIVLKKQDDLSTLGLAVFHKGFSTSQVVENVSYSDRDAGHSNGTWHLIRGYLGMQGCRKDLDDIPADLPW